MKRDLLTGTAIPSRFVNYSPTRKFNFERRRFKNEGRGGGYTARNNADAQDAVLALAQPMLQQTYQNSSFSANNSVQGQILNIPLTNVGLNTKITVEVQGTIAQAAAETLTKTPWGLANFFSNITLTDLSNYSRINTTGLHLSALASLRRQNVFGAAYLVDSPIQMGSNLAVNEQPAAVQEAVPFRFFFELPLAYHDRDLRGAIYANVTSAQWRLQLTVNSNIVVASATTDALYGCWQSTSADVGLVSNVVIKVYQHYLDQLPRDNSGNAIVPLMSLAWNYLIQNTTQTGIVAASDNPIPYANFRTFLSTFLIYNQAGTMNPGSDINYFGIQSANLVFLEKVDPFLQALRIRGIVGDDYPPGAYFFDHRRKPIDTNQFGNMQLVINPSTAAAGTYIEMGYEMLAVQAQAVQAASLPAG